MNKTKKLLDGREAIVMCEPPKSKLGIMPAVVLGFFALFLLAKSYHTHNNTLPPIIETAHAQVGPQRKGTHFTLEYHVDGIRYVRRMSWDMAQLMEGTARDFGIHPSHLIAMCIQEGSVPNSDGWMYACDPTATGDAGKARGAFQIHLGYHPEISEETATHPYAAAVWTAERLINKGYQNNKERAIRCHNSCNPNNNYGKRILQIAKTLKHI